MLLPTVFVFVFMIAGCQSGTETEKEARYTVTFLSNYQDGRTEVQAQAQVFNGEKLGIYLPIGLNGESARLDTYSFPAGRPMVPLFSAGTGRQFLEWNTKADGSGLIVDGETPVYDDTTVYAQWEAKYNLGGTNVGGPNSPYARFQMAYDPQGGNDAEGTYSYKVAISNINAKPRDLAGSGTITFNVIPCVEFDELAIALVNATNPQSPVTLASQTLSGLQSTKVYEVALNYAATSTITSNNLQVIISGTKLYLVNQIPVYIQGSENGTRFDVAPVANYTTPSTWVMPIRQEYLVRTDERQIPLMNVENGVARFNHTGEGATVARTGIELPANINLSEFTSLEIDYTCSGGWTTISGVQTEDINTQIVLLSGQLGISTTGANLLSSPGLGAAGTETAATSLNHHTTARSTKTISLQSPASGGDLAANTTNLNTVRSLVFQMNLGAREVNIYEIRFKR
jgi:hypothetical protein